MSLRTRLRQPLVPAVATVLVGGLLAFGPADATGPDTAEQTSTTSAAAAADREKDAAKDGLTRSEATYKKSAYLCYGYKACNQAGMGNAGYASASGTMYWRMYAGHNCTNYAAYRMVKSGMPNVRPWSGGGNATYWGTSVPKLTNKTPTVGSIAWWRANTGPAGSAGHVAYVEQVVSADEIIVSQDSWNGDFSWARITRASGNWPSGFIHFNDLKLVNTAAPKVTGVPRVGTRLTASSGGWKPAASTVSYQWYASGKAIAGATGSTFTLGKSRLGKVMTVQTTATRSGYPKTTALSAPTATVQPGTLTNTAAPTISGTPQVRGTLAVAAGSWKPAATALSYSWYADGQPIAGETGAQLRLGPKLLGHAITAAVRASRTAYTSLGVTTAATGPVAPGTISVTRKPGLSGTPRVGSTLTVVPGAYRPANPTTTVQWLRNGQPIPGATGTTYQLRVADLGARISASVTASRTAFTPAPVATGQTRSVRVVPRLKIERIAGRHSTRLIIRVVARGVSVVPGTVRVRVQGGFRQTLTLRNGATRVVLKGLPQGKRNARIAYVGSPTVTKLVRKLTVRLPAPKR